MERFPENVAVYKNVLQKCPSVAFHKETSHSFCFEKQMTAFYMKCKIGLKSVKGTQG